MRSRMRLAALCLGLATTVFVACNAPGGEPSSSVVVPSTPTPSTADKTPAPTPTPTVESSIAPTEVAEVTYAVSDFCPTQNIYISYILAPQDDHVESYCEYRRQKGDYELIQRRYISSTQEPYVEVFAYSADEILLHFSRESVGYTYDFTSRSDDDRRVLLKAPVNVGARWNIPGGRSEITAVDKLITLPMGEVRVTEVSTHYEEGGREEMLFMADVGVVAHYIYDAEGHLSSAKEANEYESGRKFVQTIRFFYADYMDVSGKMYYRLREVEVDNNPSMEKIFRDLLQSAPSDSTLLPLSQGIDIKGITLRGRSVYVNFSEELGYMVDQLNLNRRVEPTFLQALVNTFGEYYQATQVYIQIEGEPYASKYRVWTEDDYLSPDMSKVERYR